MGTPADPAWMMGMPHPKSLVGTNPQTAELASLWTTTMERVVASSSSSADARMQLASAQPLVPQPVAHAPEVAPNEHVLFDTDGLVCFQEHKARSAFVMTEKTRKTDCSESSSL